LDTIKTEFLEQLKNYDFFKEESTLWSYSNSKIIIGQQAYFTFFTEVSPSFHQSRQLIHLVVDFFLIVVWDFWYSGHYGLLYQPRIIGDGDCGEIGGM
jgi:hypothetical protein